jgi:thiol-disulfide isomerase/thioredoxin
MKALLMMALALAPLACGTSNASAWPPEKRALLVSAQGVERATAPGKRIAAFRVAALTQDGLDPSRTFSPSSFAGRPFLLEVWATWCRACVAAMPRLHDVHSRYGARIPMLSISVDDDPHDVTTFRTGSGHEMPWLHASVPRTEDQDALFTTLLGAPGIRVTPLYVLVGADGIILASSPDLVPSTMPEHLDRLLGPVAPD